jgi:diacylglycerol kinase (ATP)
MPGIAVVAHSRKSLGGGLPELRRVLAAEGVTDPLWYEATKSRHARSWPRRRRPSRSTWVLVTCSSSGSVTAVGAT